MREAGEIQTGEVAPLDIEPGQVRGEEGEPGPLRAVEVETLEMILLLQLTVVLQLGRQGQAGDPRHQQHQHRAAQEDGRHPRGSEVTDWSVSESFCNPS